MTTVQHFLRWLKERSSKRGRKSKCSGSNGPEVDPSEFNICPRSLMKLPPIPRDVTLSPDMTRELCETPSYHVYEEIPYDALDRVIPLDYDVAHNPNLDIHDLDFKRAKEFGHFLVVPMRGRCPEQARVIDRSAHRRQGHSAPCRRPEAEIVSDNDSGLSFNSPAGAQNKAHSKAQHQAQQWRDPRFKWIFHEGCQAPARNGWDQRPHPNHNNNTCSAPHHHSNRQVQERPDVRPASGNFHSADGYRNDTNGIASEVNINRQSQANNGAFTNRMCLGVAALKDPIREQLLQKSRGPEQSVPLPVLGDCCHDGTLQSTSTDSGVNTSQGKHSFSDSDVSGVYAISSGDSSQSHEGPGDVTGTRIPRSDGSNDTFSEYDIKSDDSLIQDELYDFYLSKVRDNLILKEHVQQIIKSETESSDCEAESIINGDNISLTSVTSMSESSLADEEIAKLCAEMHRLSQEIRHSSPNDDACVAKEKAKGIIKKNFEADLKEKHTKRREKRKRDSKDKSKPMEYYKLPDFPQQTGSAFQIYKKRQDSSDSSSSTYDIDPADKLSCRATKYQPPPKPKSSKSHCKNYGSALGRSAPAKNTSTIERPQDRNKLLSDLMRLNHDRQIMVLL